MTLTEFIAKKHLHGTQHTLNIDDADSIIDKSVGIWDVWNLPVVTEPDGTVSSLKTTRTLCYNYKKKNCYVILYVIILAICYYNKPESLEDLKKQCIRAFYCLQKHPNKLYHINTNIHSIEDFVNIMVESLSILTKLINKDTLTVDTAHI